MNRQSLQALASRFTRLLVASAAASLRPPGGAVPGRLLLLAVAFLLAGAGSVHANSGCSVEFDGVDDYATVDSPTTLKTAITTALTIEAWVKLDDPSRDQKVFGNLQQVGGTWRGYCLGVKSNKLYAEVYNSSGTQYTFQQGTVGTAWTHLAVTWLSGGYMRGYVNGVKVAEISVISAAIGQSTGSANMGRAPWGNFYVDGQIAEPRVWNVERSATQIAQGVYRQLSRVTSGIQCYYQFAGEGAGSTVTDASDKGNSLAIYGAVGRTSGGPTLFNIGGGTASTLLFGGPESGVTTPLNVDQSSSATPVSFEAWVFPGGDPSGDHYVVSTGQYTWGIYHSSGYWYVTTGSDTWYTGFGVDREQWQHVAAVWSGGTIRFYKNGVEASVSGKTSYKTNDENVAIGARRYGGLLYGQFLGAIDDVRVWNTALTASQVQSRRSTTLSGDETGLMGYWRFDDAVGSTVADSSNYRNSGSLVNMEAATAFGLSTAPLGERKIGNALSAPALPAATVQGGTLRHPLYRLDVAVTGARADVSGEISTISSLSVRTGGTYQTSDVSRFDLWYSTDSTFDSGDTLVASQTTAPASGGSLSFSLLRGIAEGTTGRFFVTADLSATAGGGRTLSVASFNSLGASGTVSMASDMTGSVQTFLTPKITFSALSVAAGRAVRGTTNQVLYGAKLEVGVLDATLTALSVQTAGTYQTSDVTAFRLWYSADATFDGTDVQLAQLAAVASGQTLAFSGFSKTIAAGASGYLIVTAGIAAGAVVDRTLAVAQTALTNFTFTLEPIRVGSALLAGGTQSLYTPPVATVTVPAVSGGQVAQGTKNYTVYRLNVAVADYTVALAGVALNLRGTYAPSDLDRFVLRGSTDAVLDGADPVLATVTTVPAPGGTVTFAGLSRSITAGTTVYLFVTIDVDDDASGGKSVYIAETPADRVTFSATDVVRTSTAPMPAGNLHSFPISPYIAADTGFYHTLGLKKNGMVWTWGNNTEGQLGDGTTDATLTAVLVEGLTDVTAVAAGDYFSLALRKDGTVFAWGQNDYGQLGDGTLANRQRPVQVLGLTGITAIAAGSAHCLALKADGSVYAWGSNRYGQLGDGTTTGSSTPVRVGGGLSAIAAVEASGEYSLALKSGGTVYAWGLNDFGQLGDRTATYRTTPTVIAGLSGITALAAGKYHALALQGAANKVWGWGCNEQGQLGNGSTLNPASPVQVSGLTGTVVGIAAGNRHSLAMLDTGRVWAWGWNQNGQLGNGTTTSSSVPVQVSSLTDAKGIAAAGDYSLALRIDGTLYAWGHNQYGQLGDSTTTDRNTPVRGGVVPVVVITGLPVTAGLVQRGATHQVLHRFELAVTDADITLTGLNLTTAGTYAASEIADGGFKLYYSTDNAWSADDVLLATSPFVPTGGTLSFSGIQGTVARGQTGYLLVTADVSAAAVGGRTIAIGPTPFADIVLAQQNTLKSGTTPVPGGAEIGFPLFQVAIGAVAVPAQTVSQNAADRILYGLTLRSDDGAVTLNSLYLHLDGTYTIPDLVQDSLTLRLSADATLDAADPVVAFRSVVEPGGALHFSDLGLSLAQGTTWRLFFTMDASPTAGGGRTIGVESVEFAEMSFAEGFLLKTGTDPVPAGGLQTFPPALVTVTAPVTAAGTVSQDATDVVLCQVRLTVSDADTTLTALTLVTGGTYRFSDMPRISLRYSQDGVLDAADPRLATAAPLESGQPLRLDLAQFISKGTTATLFVTADIGGRAIVRNVGASVASLEFSDTVVVQPSDAFPSPVGGTQTFPTPAVAVAAPAIAPAVVEQNTPDLVLWRLNLTAGNARSELTSLTVRPLGTYLPADLTGFKLRASADAILDPTDEVLGTLPAVESGTPLAFASIGRILERGTTAYLFVTADIGAANGARTLWIEQTGLADCLDFAEGDAVVLSGTDPVPASGVQTFPVPNLAITAPAVAAGAVEQQTADSVLYRINVAVTRAEAVLQGLTVKTGGTYLSKDLVGASFKLRYSDDENLDPAMDETLGTCGFVASGGTVGFHGFSKQIARNATGYLFVTMDTDRANGARTIFIDQTPFSQIEFAYGVKQGTSPVAAGGMKTFPLPQITISAPEVAAREHVQDTVNQVLYRLDIEVERAEAVLQGLTVTTAGTYLPSDLVANSFKLRFSEDSLLTASDPVLSTLPFVAAGGNLAFTGLAQTIERHTTGHLFVTVDMGSAVGRHIMIAATPVDRLSFEFKQLMTAGSMPAGGAQRFPGPVIEISAPAVDPTIVAQRTADRVLYRIAMRVTKAEAILTDLALTTGGTYRISDISTDCSSLASWTPAAELATPAFKLRYSTDEVLDAADPVLAQCVSVPAGGRVTFGGMAQKVPKKTTGYLFVTANIGPAVGGRTIRIEPTPFQDIAFTYRERVANDPPCDKVGTSPLPAGGTMTFPRMPDNVLEFDGADDYVAFAWSAQLNAARFTVSVRANVAGGDGTRRAVLSSVREAGFQGYEIYIDTDNTWKARIGDGAHWYVIAGPGVIAHRWYDLSLTFNGSRLLFYVNGQPFDGNLGNIAFSPNPSAPFRLGRQAEGNGYFTGQMDEIVVWDHALTQAEIQALIGHPPTDNETGILAHFRFDPWGTMRDTTGNGNDGTLTGKPTWAFVLAGLWVGQVEINRVNEVGSATDTQTPRPVDKPFDQRMLLHVDKEGKVRLLRDITVMQRTYSVVRQEDGTRVDMSRRVLVSDDRLLPNYQGVVNRDGKMVGLRLGTAAYDFDPALNELLLNGSVREGASITGSVTLSKSHPDNPFRHLYHPDHRSGRAIQRSFTLTIDPQDQVDPLAGVFKFGGTYRETIEGLHKLPLEVSGTFSLERVSMISRLNDQE